MHSSKNRRRTSARQHHAVHAYACGYVMPAERRGDKQRPNREAKKWAHQQLGYGALPARDTDEQSPKQQVLSRLPRTKYNQGRCATLQSGRTMIQGKAQSCLQGVSYYRADVLHNSVLSHQELGTTGLAHHTTGQVHQIEWREHLSPARY